jgi:hypothetical protein
MVTKAAGREVSIPGRLGISLEQFAAAVGGQLALCNGLTTSVLLEHRSDVRALMQDIGDLTDLRQPRYSELSEMSNMIVTSAGAMNVIVSASTYEGRLSTLTQF